jgi:hypothetical protein
MVFGTPDFEIACADEFGALCSGRRYVLVSPAYQIRARDVEHAAPSSHSRGPIARVASIMKINFQCFQILEQEVHNERVI